MAIPDLSQFELGDDRGAATPAGSGEPWVTPEGIAVKPNGLGCRIVDYRVDLGELAERYDRVSAELIDDQPAG